jgi:hypothetical protein
MDDFFEPLDGQFSPPPFRLPLRYRSSRPRLSLRILDASELPSPPFFNADIHAPFPSEMLAPAAKISASKNELLDWHLNGL